MKKIGNNFKTYECREKDIKRDMDKKEEINQWEKKKDNCTQVNSINVDSEFNVYMECALIIISYQRGHKP